MSTLFVTAMYNLYPDEALISLNHTEKWSERWLAIDFRLEHFRSLLDSNIELVVYTSPTLIPLIGTVPDSVRLIPLEIEEIPAYQHIMSRPELELPGARNPSKDKLEYFALMNSKMDLVYNASKLLPEYDHYAWIDASIFKLVKNTREAQSSLHRLSQLQLPDKIISGTGVNYCMYPLDPLITNSAHWRFLGSTLVVPKESINPFYGQCLRMLNYCIKNKLITWEINIWARIESLEPDLFLMYQADHNDSIITALESIVIKNGESNG